MQWLELTVQTTPRVIDLVAANLTVLGFDRFIIDDEADFQTFLENNRQYWDYVDEKLAQSMQGVSRIRLYIEDGPEAPAQIRFLRMQLDAMREQYAALEPGNLSLEIQSVREEDWETSWKQYYQPIAVGRRLLVVPEWMQPENPDGRTEIRLDPGMIFGTGAHASTQMCMEALEGIVRGGERVIDLGSGSGILSITSLLLGAAAATGVDIDPKAEDIARENAAINGIGPDRFTARTGDVIGDRILMDELAARPWDLVLANIVADVIIPLCPLVPRLLRRDGRFVCSGILDTRLPEVLQAIAAAGLVVERTDSRDDWCAVTARNKQEASKNAETILPT